MQARPFGKYLLDRELARGGMARVHSARLRGLGGFEKRLVLKEIHPALAQDPRFVALFVEEAKTLVELSHPHIVPVYELGIVDGTYFLAMEHVRGGTLEQLVRERRLDADEAAHLGAQVADALAYAHDRFSLVHRDVTPRNVMVDAHGHARLLDFGIATRLDDTSGTAAFGTPGFLSPEQARGERVTASSDLFALAAVLVYACTGRSPLPSETAAMRAWSGPAPEALADLPAELVTILGAALAADPRERPAHGKLLASQLRAFLAARRPGGVADALGERAERTARLQEEDAVTPTDDAPSAVAIGRTESLATSTALVAMLTPPGTIEARNDAPDAAPRIDDEPVVGTVPLTPRVARDPQPTKSDDDLPDAPPEPKPEPKPEPSSPAEPSPTEPSPTTPSPTAPSSPVAARPPSTTARWLVPALAAAMAAAATVGVLRAARFDAPTRELEPLPLDPTPLEIDPPDAGADDAGSALGDAGASDAPDAGSDSEAVAGEPPSAREPTPRSERPDARPSHESAHLTVQAMPWADVSLDGRPLGRTPLRERAIPAGDHRLTLACPALGREVERRVHVDADGSLRVSANLQSDPPSWTER